MNNNVKKEKSKFLNNRSLIIILAVAVVISITASAMTVDKFTDYEPPSTLVIRWGDYYANSFLDEVRTDNAVTAFPSWRAEYPYRALLLGRQYGSASSSKLNTQYHFIIYSKKPVTDLFTFKYHGNRMYPRTGFIRAQFNKRVFLETDDIKILYRSYDTSNYEPISPYLDIDMAASTWHINHTDDSGPLYELYFDFDFYYNCTDKHQQNTQLLNVSGLRNITDVPYAYILTCDAHGSGGGSTSGSGASSDDSSGSSGGSSSGGGGSSSGGSSYPWEDDSKTPDLSGSSSGSSDSGFTAGEGTTGEKGDTWELPEYIPPDMSWSTDDLNIPEMPGINLPEIPEPFFNFPSVPEPSFNFPAAPGMPEVELPPVPYEPGESTWPPPFPGTE